MDRCLVLVSMLIAGLAGGPAAAGGPVANPNYNPPPPKQGYSYPDCYCTDSQGRRVELGRTVCLTVGQRRVLALCDISVNSPTWRYDPEAEGCPGV